MSDTGNHAGVPASGSGTGGAAAEPPNPVPSGYVPPAAPSLTEQVLEALGFKLADVKRATIELTADASKESIYVTLKLQDPNRQYHWRTEHYKVKKV